MDENEEPEKYLYKIAQFFQGSFNETELEKILNAPILKPTVQSSFWIFLIQYALLSVFGILGNLAIMAYSIYHKLYNDTTHAFLINLSVCHIVQCAVVLPITLVVMLIQHWIFGRFLCFFLPMLQDIPLHVAVFSHLLIAWDRMRWLGDPLKCRLPTFVCCCATWLMSMIIALPYPIYILYVEIGEYVPQLSGFGLCVVNLMDDMHEYIRGLFVMMYCGPTVLLSYMYIRTSQELRPPDGPFAVMMFEHRSEVRNRQRTQSTTSHHSDRPSRQNSQNDHNFGLFNAELDIYNEKRMQRCLGTMAASQIICVGPLMILKMAKMVIPETYENSKSFDFTYLMFVWIAFLPTVIFPVLYGVEVLPRTERDRLRGYFRLSSRAMKASKGQRRDPSIENEDTTITHKTVIEHSLDDESEKLQNSHKSSSVRMREEGKMKVNTISNGHKHPSLHKTKPKHINNGAPRSASLKSTISTTGGLDVSSYKLSNPHKKLTVDSLNTSNSNSNITASTYLNNGGSSIDYESTTGKLDMERKWPGVGGGSLKNKDVSFSDCSSFRRMDSSSTLERDLEIIDYLERERSMDIQDMMEREKHGGSDVMRRSSFERRRLPDIDKIRRSPRPIYSYDKRPSLDTETCAEEDESVVEDEPAEDQPIQCYRQHQQSSMAKFYSRRMNRKTSHQSSSSHRKREFCTFNDDDFLAGTFGDLDPTQPLSKMSVIENRIRRPTGRTSSVCSSGRNSLRSRDFSISPHAHPELDFRENFADL